MTLKHLVILTAFAVASIISCDRPATDPIVDTNGLVVPESIASLERVYIGDMDQWLLIRGRDRRNPVLLWLHGGPGAAQMPIARHFNTGLEDHFVVVHWDQRGAGKSNPRGFDESTIRFESFLNDTREVTLYLKKRFGQKKIFLLGHSWGSQLGIRVAHSYPEEYHAYIGVSQVVNGIEADKISYDWLRARMRETGNARAEVRLARLGEPPYTDHDRFVRFIGMIDDFGGGMDIGFATLARIALFAPEYGAGDYLAWLRGANRGSGPMWNTTKNMDLFNDVPSLEIPAYFFCGRNDYNTPLSLIERYCAVLKAPRGKRLIVFERSAHTPFMMEAERFNRELVRVRHETL